MNKAGNKLIIIIVVLAFVILGGIGVLLFMIFHNEDESSYVDRLIDKTSAIQYISDISYYPDNYDIKQSEKSYVIEGMGDGNNKLSTQYDDFNFINQTYLYSDIFYYDNLGVFERVQNNYKAKFQSGNKIKEIKDLLKQGKDEERISYFLNNEGNVIDSDNVNGQKVQDKITIVITEDDNNSKPKVELFINVGYEGINQRIKYNDLGTSQSQELYYNDEYLKKIKNCFAELNQEANNLIESKSSANLKD